MLKKRNSIKIILERKSRLTISDLWIMQQQFIVWDFLFSVITFPTTSPLNSRCIVTSFTRILQQPAHPRSSARRSTICQAPSDAVSENASLDWLVIRYYMHARKSFVYFKGFFFLPEGPVTEVFELFHIKPLKHFNRAFNRICQIEGKQIERV